MTQHVPRPAVVAVALLVAAVSIVALAELTQTRPEQLRPGTSSEVVLRVSSRAGPQHEEAAARLLWDSCRDQLRGRQDIGNGLVRRPDGRFRLLVSPALGTHSERRLTGCLQDARVDFVLARLESVRELPAG